MLVKLLDLAVPRFARPYGRLFEKAAPRRLVLYSLVDLDMIVLGPSLVGAQQACCLELSYSSELHLLLLIWLSDLGLLGRLDTLSQVSILNLWRFLFRF